MALDIVVHSKLSVPGVGWPELNCTKLAPELAPGKFPGACPQIGDLAGPRAGSGNYSELAEFAPSK